MYKVLRAGQEDVLRQYVESLSKLDVYGFDTETTGLDMVGSDRSMGSVTVGYSFSHRFGHGVYVPFAHTEGLEGRVPGQMQAETVFEIVRPLLEGKLGRACAVMHNAPFDIAMIAKDGILVESTRVHCTSTAVKLLSLGTGRWDPRGPDHGGDSRRSLKSLTEELLGITVLRLDDLTEDKAGFGKLPPFEERVVAYAAADASNVLGLKERLDLLLKQFDLEQAYHIERNLMVPLVAMYKRGVLLDGEQCRVKAAEGKEAALAVERQFCRNLSRELGREVTPENLKVSSSQQLAAVLFEPKPEGLGLPVLKVTPKGKPSTDRSVLNALADQFPIVNELLSYRKLSKNLEAFLEALPGHINPNTGRVHARFDPFGTDTGRFSSSKPNLQQLPRRGVEYYVGDEVRVANVRDVIVAAEGYYLFDSDYSQIEYRAMAGEAGEVSLIEAFNRGEDIHQRTASLIYHVPYEEVTPQLRDGGKTNNFALLYGRGVPALAAALGITEEEATKLREEYFAKLPAIRRWSERVADEAQLRGYAVTRFGRRRWLEEFESPIKGVRNRGRRQAVNMHIQGVCADLMKIGIVKLWRNILDRGLFGKVWPIMTVHDSIVLEVHESIPPHVAYRLINDSLVVEIEGWPVIQVDCKVGYRYGSLREYAGEEDFVLPPRHETTELAPVPSALDEVLPVENGDDEEENGGPLEPLTPLPPKAVVVEISTLTAEQVERFKRLIHENPGENEVMCVVNGTCVNLKSKTSLGPESYAWTQVGQVRVKWSENPVDVLAEVEL